MHQITDYMILKWRILRDQKGTKNTMQLYSNHIHDT